MSDLQHFKAKMSYLQHLKANWKVAGHSFLDFLEHFLHGLCPAIKWEHKQGVKNQSAGDEIRQKSDEELATFIEIVSRCGRCQWCIHNRDCYLSDDKKCAQGVKAFLGKTVMYEE